MMFIHYDIKTGDITGWGTTSVPREGQAVAAFEVKPGTSLEPDAATQKIDVKTGRLVDMTEADQARARNRPRLFSPGGQP
jgi:hypothetical protein